MTNSSSPILDPASTRPARPIWRDLWTAQRSSRERLILLSGTVLQPLQTRRWLLRLRDEPLLAALAKAHPAWPLKIYRPYLSRRLGGGGRIDVLMQHYRLLDEAGLGAWAFEITQHSMPVAYFSGKSGTEYRLDLSAVGMGSREGELYLQLVTGKILLYRMAFSLVSLGGVSCISVGCVQGVRAEDGADSVRSTTRELHGCRPKNLLIAVVRDLGDYFGCREMIGVSNDNRIIARNARGGGPAPDYDRTWEEIGAKRTADGNFALPCDDILRSNFEDVPSKKRSEAKKRNALLAAIFSDVRASLDRQRFLHVRQA